MTEYIDLVNSKDEVIGKALRSEVHQKGLLHRHVNVFFVTPQKEVIFQHRAQDKDTYPGLLDSTVGGHVDLGLTYTEAALQEMNEETGVAARAEELVFLKKIGVHATDSDTSMTNNIFACTYAYIFRGQLSDLHIEEGKAVGFEAFNIDDLQNLHDEERQKFIPNLVNDEYLELYREMKQLALQ